MACCETWKTKSKTDGRVSPEALLENRKQAINSYGKGMRLKDISEATGLCRQAVRNAIGLCGRHGVKGLCPGRRGRPSGKGRRLAEEQERQIQKDIRNRRPKQLKMRFALWTSEHMEMARTTPERVKTYFKGRHVCHAAESM